MKQNSVDCSFQMMTAIIPAPVPDMNIVNLFSVEKAAITFFVSIFIAKCAAIFFQEELSLFMIPLIRRKNKGSYFHPVLNQ